MLAKVFMDAGKEPTVIVGSFLKDQKSNFIAGNGPFLVEACEYKRSFLNLSPKILIITNIDLDHLDYYKDLEDIQNAFRELVEKVPADGLVVTDATHPNVAPVLLNVKAKVIDYTKENKNLELSLPGAHNIANAQAVIAVSKYYGLQEEAVRESLTHFSGTWRRFDYKGKTKEGTLVYDDYAHHPKEVEASISGFREKFPNKKLTILFQPHLFSRTKDHLDAFAEVLKKADMVLVLPIYAAREKDPGDITSNDLVKKIGEQATLIKSKEEALVALRDLKEDDILVTMGAGDVYTIGEGLLTQNS
jgi:UDP-N-acetylmuramate--alanine ligase